MSAGSNQNRGKDGAGATPYFQNQASEGFQNSIKGIGEFQFSAETAATNMGNQSRFSGEFRPNKKSQDGERPASDQAVGGLSANPMGTDDKCKHFFVNLINQNQ